MLPYIHYEQIKIGLFSFNVWGIFFALAVIFASFLFIKKTVPKILTENKVLEFLICIVISIIIGARVGYSLSHAQEFDNFSTYFFIWNGGLSIYGGIIAATIYWYLFSKRNKINPLVIGDQLAMPLAIALAIGRTGCFLVGEHIGKETSFFLGLIINGKTYHSSSLYELILGLLIYGILIFLPKNKKTGTLMFSFLFLYALGRFFIEFTRVESYFWILTYSQWVSLLIIILIIAGPIIKNYKEIST